MLEYLKELDTKLFLALNGLHSEFFDIWMFRLTSKIFWVPLFLIIIYFLVRTYQREAIWIILFAIIAISFSDMLVSGFMKSFFERLRPSRDPALEGLVHIVNNYRGGSYGFASGHAATSFCLAAYLVFVARKKLPWIWIMFIWSTLFTYTRIYLGVHYPGDILVGMLIGVGFAYLGSRSYQWTLKVRKERERFKGS